MANINYSALSTTMANKLDRDLGNEVEGAVRKKTGTRFWSADVTPIYGPLAITSVIHNLGFTSEELKNTRIEVSLILNTALLGWDAGTEIRNWCASYSSQITASPTIILESNRAYWISGNGAGVSSYIAILRKDTGDDDYIRKENFLNIKLRFKIWY